MRLRIGAALAAAALVCGGPGAAQAALQYAVTGYHVGFPLEDYRAFDTSLGTLKSVRFDIFYAFTPTIISDTTAQLYPLFVARSISGVAGKGYDMTIGPPFRIGSILTTGPGAPAGAVAPFLHETFGFDAISEFTGVSVSATGAVLGARLSDFYPGGPFAPFIAEAPVYSVFAINTNTGARMDSVFTSVSGGGTVTYGYEPFAPAGVPEPASWALMIAGFVLAGATLRRGRRAHA